MFLLKIIMSDVFFAVDIETTGPRIPVGDHDADCCFAIGYAFGHMGEKARPGKICLDISTILNRRLDIHNDLANHRTNMYQRILRLEVQASSDVKRHQPPFYNGHEYEYMKKLWGDFWGAMKWKKSTFDGFWGKKENILTLQRLVVMAHGTGVTEEMMMQKLQETLDEVKKSMGPYVLVTDCIQFDIPWLSALLAKYNLRQLQFDVNGDWVRASCLDDLLMGQAYVMPNEKYKRYYEAIETMITPAAVGDSSLCKHDPEYDALNILHRMHCLSKRVYEARLNKSSKKLNGKRGLHSEVGKNVLFYSKMREFDENE